MMKHEFEDFFRRLPTYCILPWCRKLKECQCNLIEIMEVALDNVSLGLVVDAYRKLGANPSTQENEIVKLLLEKYARQLESSSKSRDTSLWDQNKPWRSDGSDGVEMICERTIATVLVEASKRLQMQPDDNMKQITYDIVIGLYQRYVDMPPKWRLPDEVSIELFHTCGGLYTTLLKQKGVPAHAPEWHSYLLNTIESSTPTCEVKAIKPDALDFPPPTSYPSLEHVELLADASGGVGVVQRKKVP